MDPRRERELIKQLPFPLDPPSTLADALPIATERIVGFTLIVCTYILLTLWPFILVCTAMARVDVTTRVAMWQILGRTMTWIYGGAVVWMLLWFLVYVVLDFKGPSSLARIPGMTNEAEEADDEEVIVKPRTPKARRPEEAGSRTPRR